MTTAENMARITLFLVEQGMEVYDLKIVRWPGQESGHIWFRGEGLKGIACSQGTRFIFESDTMNQSTPFDPQNKHEMLAAWTTFKLM